MAVDPGSGDGLKVSLFESGDQSKPGVTLPSRRSDHTDLGRQSPRTGASGAASIHGGVGIHPNRRLSRELTVSFDRIGG